MKLSELPATQRLIKPRIFSSNCCESFFGILRAKKRIFNIFEFAHMFHTAALVFEQRQAGPSVSGYIANTGRGGNNFKSSDLGA